MCQYHSAVSVVGFYFFFSEETTHKNLHSPNKKRIANDNNDSNNTNTSVDCNISVSIN